jgi:hypothetical protein
MAFLNGNIAGRVNRKELKIKSQTKTFFFKPKKQFYETDIFYFIMRLHDNMLK